MNLRDLQYLVAVSDKLHFGKAAASCNISQPTLSMQLKKLEEYLGVQFFERTNKKVLMTPVGQQIATVARLILQDSDQIREIAKMAKDQFAGEIKLGIFPTLAPYLLPLLMPKLKTEFPDLNILLVEEKTSELIRRLKTGDIDCAMLAMPVDEHELTAYKIFEEPFLLAVAAAHPLAKHKSVAFSDAKNETMLLLEDGHCLREQALEVCHTIGMGEANSFRATSMTTLLQMVAMGDKVTLVPKLATLVSNQSLHYIPFKHPTPSRTIGLYIRKTSARTALFDKLSQVIKAFYKEL